MDFSQTCISTSPTYALPIIVATTWTPSYDLHKLIDTQSILMYHSVVKVYKKIAVLSFSKLSFKLASAYMLPQSSDICLQKVVIC